jgi:hypothetical protein
VRYLRHENSNLKKNALSKMESLCHVDSKRFLYKKSSKYFPRKTHFKLAIFELAAVLSGGVGGFV